MTGQPVVQRGCELALFLPRKQGNLDCTFCLDCVHACPHDNIGVVARLPGSELWTEGTRSGVGEPHRRRDLAALSVAFTFGALVNAFGMVSPVYAFMRWLNEQTGVSSRAGLLGTLFFLALVVEPVILLGLAALAARWLMRDHRSPLALVTRYAASLVPLGFGIWLAHYAFHFLTGVLTVVPVMQNALMELAGPMPRTTAAMLQLDRLHRAGNPLGAALAAKLRYSAADALGCAYARRYAEADLSRAGASERDLKRLSGAPHELPPAERAALAFARKLTLAGHSPSDEEFSELLDLFGAEKVVAIVHTVAGPRQLPEPHLPGAGGRRRLPAAAGARERLRPARKGEKRREQAPLSCGVERIWNPSI
jgi:alkylhydroperoxidase family enzyme